MCVGIFALRISSFLVSARKERKEVDIGEALKAALPRVKSALSYVPHPARTWQVPHFVTSKNGRYSTVTTAGADALPALPRYAFPVLHKTKLPPESRYTFRGKCF